MSQRKSTRLSRKSDKSSRKRKNEENNIEDPVLEGLTIEDGKIIVDEHVLKRLKRLKSLKETDQTPPEKTTINPFINYPDFSNVHNNGEPLSSELLQRYSDKFNNNPESVKMAEMMGNIPIDFLSLQYSQMKADNWDYNTKLSVSPTVVSQESSGRCWIYAATNCLRYSIMKKFHLCPKFEFSQGYIFFYDKIERANVFLQYMWELKDRDLRDPIVSIFNGFEDNPIITDGGVYTYYQNLVKKYGIVPKNVYGDGFNCKLSDYMNNTVKLILNHMCLEIRRNNWTQEEFNVKKEEYMETVYDLYVRFLGEPPKPTDTFTWTFKDIHGESHEFKNLTPEKFYRVVVPHDDEMVTIIHDPRHPETQFMTSWVEGGINIQGGLPFNMINVPLDVFKRVVYSSLENDEPVWFCCDVSKSFDSECKTWDTKRFNYNSILGCPTTYDKGDMLDALTSKPTHAMCFNGVDVEKDIDDKVTKYNRWRVDNSWGYSLEELEKDSGFYKMMDNYFDQYVYCAAVNLKYFNPKETETMVNNADQGKYFTYDLTDAFGTVASCDCRSCLKGKKPNKV